MNQTNESSPALKILNDNWQLIKCILFYGLLVGIMLLIMQWFRGLNVYGNYIGTVTAVASKLLHLLSVEHDLHRAYLVHFDDMIVTTDTLIRFALSKNYDGLWPIVLLVAAILVWPRGSLVGKICYAAICVASLLVLNPVRVAASVATHHHYPTYYEIAHYYIIPTLLIFIPIFLLILLWARIVEQSRQA